MVDERSTTGADHLVAARLARLLQAWCAEGVIVALGLALLIGARAALMAALWSHGGPQTNVNAALTALLRGFPFDCRVSVVVCLPTLVFSLTALGWAWPDARRRVRRATAVLLLTVIPLLTVLDYYYFREYASQFDHFIIGLVFDDTTAILRTVWQQYPVLWALAGLLAAALGGWWVSGRLVRWQPGAWFRRMPVWGLAASIVLALGLIVCGARGSISRLPAQSKNVAVTPDEKLLNKLVLNPLAALNKAIVNYREVASGAELSPATVAAAVSRLFATPTPQGDLDALTRRTAVGADQPPRHIILLVVESYSAWPTAAAWRDFGLAERLNALAAQGVAVPRFLPESTGTMASLGPLLTGVPDAGMMQSFQRLARQTLPTAPAPIFLRLGYRTRFFYSGYLSWQNLGQLVDDQGFEAVEGGGQISDWTSGNEWGVDDRHLLDYVARQQVAAVPTFDVVLTTSNHPPFSVDVYGAGFPWRQAPPDLPVDADADLAVLGHQWYSDQAVGDFVARVARDQPDTLFVITGDHYGRRFPNRQPNAWERTAVPGVFYGPAVSGRTLAATCGSHLDLIPTLVELCAPAGFAYHALGVDLFRVPQHQTATAAGAVTTDGALEWNDRGDDTTGNAAQALEQLRADRAAFGWWRLTRGPFLMP